MGSKAWNHLHLFWTHLALPNTPGTCFGFLCPRKVRLGVQRYKVNRANLANDSTAVPNCTDQILMILGYTVYTAQRLWS